MAKLKEMKEKRPTWEEYKNSQAYIDWMEETAPEYYRLKKEGKISRSDLGCVIPTPQWRQRRLPLLDNPEHADPPKPALRKAKKLLTIRQMLTP